VITVQTHTYVTRPKVAFKEKLHVIKIPFISSILYKVDGNLMVKGTREGPLVICDQR